MEPPIIIEVLDRFGRIKERHKADHFPLKIGRSYRNDIIIDDNFISPEHLEIISDGNNQLLVRDLKSTNGLITLYPTKEHEVITLSNDQLIRIGHTDIRIRNQYHPVHEAYIDKTKFSKTKLILSHTLFLPIVLFMTFAFLMGFYYQQSTSSDDFAILVPEIIAPFELILFWAFLWVIVSKFVTHKFNLVAHTAIICFAVIGFYLLDLLQYIEFSVGVNGLAYVLDLIAFLVIVIALLYSNLRCATLLTKKRALYHSSIAAVLLVFFSSTIAQVKQQNDLLSIELSGYVKHPGFVLSTPVSVDNFILQARELKTSFTASSNIE